MYYILVNNSLEIPELWLENLINTFKSDLIYSSNNEIILKRSIDIYIYLYIYTSKYFTSVKLQHAFLSKFLKIVIQIFHARPTTNLEIKNR